MAAENADRMKMSAYKEIAPRIIYEGYRGSHSHGTRLDGADSIDDIDLMAVVVMPLEYYLGLKTFKTRQIEEGRWDIVVYDIKKFVSLLLKQNPNVCGMLWLPEEHQTVRARISREALLPNRDIFVSKKAFHSFAGYANSQFKRMTHYQAYEGYMGEKRKALVDEFGYDTKNASHLIRLLRMCIEFLGTGEFFVDRTGIDADQLIEIKTGEWALAQVKREAEGLFVKAEEAYQKSLLPDEPDYERASELCCEIILARTEEATK